MTNCVFAVETFFKSQSIMHTEEFLAQICYANAQKNSNCCLCSCAGSTLAQYWKFCLMTHLLRWKWTSSDTINKLQTAATLSKTFKNINSDMSFYHNPSRVGNLNFVWMLTPITAQNVNVTQLSRRVENFALQSSVFQCFLVCEQALQTILKFHEHKHKNHFCL
jgi:hypothetical protein